MNKLKEIVETVDTVFTEHPYYVASICMGVFLILSFIMFVYDGVKYNNKMELNKQPNSIEDLLGQRITIFCAVYIYTGKLVSVIGDTIRLKDASVVYETGAFDNPKWRDEQKFPNDLYIQRGMVESFGILK